MRPLVPAIALLLVLPFLPTGLGQAVLPIDQQVGPLCVPVIGGVLGGDTCVGFFVHVGPDGVVTWWILPCGVGNLVDSCGFTLVASPSGAQLVVYPQEGCRQVCLPSSDETDVLLPANPGDLTGVFHATCILGGCGTESVFLSGSGLDASAFPVPCESGVCPLNATLHARTDGNVSFSARALCGPAPGSACVNLNGTHPAGGSLVLHQDVILAGPPEGATETLTPTGALDVRPTPSCLFAPVGGIVECQSIDVTVTGGIPCVSIHLVGSVPLSQNCML